LFGKNQVTKIQMKTHKHYNYLRSIFNQKLFTKDIKMPSSEAWVW